MNNNEKLNVTFLSHKGVLGMEWGKRRYQYKDGSLTPEGRRHWGVGPPREKKKSFKLELTDKQKAKLAARREAKAAKNEIKQQKEVEAIRQKKIDLINKGDMDAIYKNRTLFSDDELDYAYKRITSSDRFNKNPQDKPKSIKDRIKKEIVNSGDEKLLYKNRKMFTDDELKSAISRMETLKKIDPKEKKAIADKANSVKNGKSLTDKLIKSTGDLSKLGSNIAALYGAYNKTASVANEVAGHQVMPVMSNNPWTNQQNNSTWTGLQNYIQSLSGSSASNNTDSTYDVSNVGGYSYGLHGTYTVDSVADTSIPFEQVWFASHS